MNKLHKRTPVNNMPGTLSVEQLEIAYTLPAFDKSPNGGNIRYNYVVSAVPLGKSPC